MIEDDALRWRETYRLALTEEPASALDELILAAAGRLALRARVVRRSFAVLALAVVVIVPLWLAHVTRVPRATDTSDYGRQEGATRYYLLNVASSPYAGPGSAEPNK